MNEYSGVSIALAKKKKNLIYYYGGELVYKIKIDVLRVETWEERDIQFSLNYNVDVQKEY